MKKLVTKLKQTETLRFLFSSIAIFVLTAQPAFAFGEKTIYELVVATFGRIVGLAGSALNFAVANFVIGFGDIYLDKGLGRVISLLWGNIRDMINILFIFALVYIGLKLILDSANPNAKRWLLNLIVAALLVNFSLFLSKAVIDFSNIMATQITQSFINNGKVNISETFMEKIGVTTILGKNRGGSGGNYSVIDSLVKNGGSAWPYIFGIMIVFLVTAFVFFAGAILLMVRFVSLIFYMIFSPLMFLGLILPNTTNYTRKYWDGLLGKSFMAPIYLLLLFFSFKVLGTFFQAGNSNLDFGAVFAGGGKETVASFSSTIPPFIVAIILLLASLKMSQKLGSDGAAYLNNTGASLYRGANKRLRRGAIRTAKFAGKTPVWAVGTAGGRKLSYNLGNKLDRQLRRLQSKKTFKKPTKSTSKSRVARTLDNTLGTATAAAKYGGASTVGWLARTKAIDNTTKKTAKAMKDGKFFTGETQKEHQQRMSKISEESKIINNLDKTVESFEEAVNSEQRTKAISEAGFIKNMTAEELQAAVPKSNLTNGAIAYNLTDQQIKDLLKSGYVTEKEAAEIKESRNDATFSDLNETLSDLNQSTEKIEGAVKELSEIIRSLNNERVENLDFDSYLNNERYAMHLTDKQMEHLKQSPKFTKESFKEIEDARVRGMEAAVNGDFLKDLSNGRRLLGPQQKDSNDTLLDNTSIDTGRLKETSGKILFEKMNNKEISKLPTEIFLNKNTSKYLNPESVESRLKEGDLSEVDLATLSNNINSVIRQDTQKAKAWRKWQDRSMMGGVLSLDTTTKDRDKRGTVSDVSTESMRYRIRELKSKISSAKGEDVEKIKEKLKKETASLYEFYKNKSLTENLTKEETREWGSIMIKDIKRLRDRLHSLSTDNIENRDQIMSELEFELKEKLRDQAKLDAAYKNLNQNRT